jgi:integrase
MSVYTDRRTGHLFIQFNFRCQTYKKFLPGSATRDEAKQIETKWRHDLFLEEQGMLVIEENETWERFVDCVYLEHVAANQSEASLEKAIAICKASMKHFKGMRIRDIKPSDIERFKAERMQTPTRYGKVRKAATVHREMSIIFRVFSMALDDGLCSRNPCKSVKLPKFDNVQDRILHLDDEEKFLIAIRNSLQRDICLTVLYTGLRQNDVLGLSKSHVDLREGMIRLIQGKTKRRVNIPLLPRLEVMLSQRIKLDGDLLFPSYRTGNKLTTIKNSIIFACVRANIERLTIRDLRRTFGTRLHENGYDDKTIADLLGHTDTRSVHRYKRGTEIKRKAILSLENMVGFTANSTQPEITPEGESLKANKTLVEMRGIEPLTSALRTNRTAGIIH